MYRRIDCRLWMDPKVRKMEHEVQRLFFYLMANMHTHLCGVYYLPEVLIAHELNTSMDAVKYGLGELQDQGRIEYDHESEVVWVVNMLKHQVMSKDGTISDKSKVAIRTQMDTLSVPDIRAKLCERYPIDSQSIVNRYPIDTLSDPGLQVKVKSKVKEEVKNKIKYEEKEAKPAKVEASILTLSRLKNRPWTKGLSWVNGDRITDNQEDRLISDLSDDWAKVWEKPKPRKPPTDADLCRILEAMWDKGDGGVSDEAMKNIRLAIRGQHTASKASDIEKNWSSFIHVFPPRELDGRKDDNSLSWSKFNRFVDDGASWKPPIKYVVGQGPAR